MTAHKRRASKSAATELGKPSKDVPQNRVSGGGIPWTTLGMTIIALIIGQQSARLSVLPSAVRQAPPISTNVNQTYYSQVYNPDEPRFGVKYGYKDFARQFGVVPLHRTFVDLPLVPYLRNHDPRSDPSYLEDPSTFDRDAALFGHMIDEGTERDERFYAAWTGNKGYGMFAEVPIKAGEGLGVFGGVVTNTSMNSAWAWGYNSDLQILTPDGELGLVLDGKDKGNMLRFANHDDDPNSEARMIPYRGLWHVVYVAKRDIAKDEEVTVNYGEGYWQSMGYEPVLSGRKESDEIA